MLPLSIRRRRQWGMREGRGDGPAAEASPHRWLSTSPVCLLDPPLRRRDGARRGTRAGRRPSPHRRFDAPAGPLPSSFGGAGPPQLLRQGRGPSCRGSPLLPHPASSSSVASPGKMAVTATGAGAGERKRHPPLPCSRASSLPHARSAARRAGYCAAPPSMGSLVRRRRGEQGTAPLLHRWAALSVF
jgi:hypothetical protein